MLPGMKYAIERAQIEPDSRVLLYTDGLTEIFCDREEFGQDRLLEAFRQASESASLVPPSRAELTLDRLWTTLDTFLRWRSGAG